MITFEVNIFPYQPKSVITLSSLFYLFFSLKDYLTTASVTQETELTHYTQNLNLHVRLQKIRYVFSTFSNQLKFTNLLFRKLG